MDQRTKCKSLNYKIFRRKHGLKSSWPLFPRHDTKSIRNKRKKVEHDQHLKLLCCKGHQDGEKDNP